MPQETQWGSRLLAFLSASKHAGARNENIVNDEERMLDLLLQSNSSWFIRLRWLVIASFPFLALGKSKILGLNLVPSSMFFSLATVLAVANLIYCFHHQMLEEENRKEILLNIWVQILVDLIVITVMIHQMNWLILGGIGPLLYFPHIVLACIMLNKRGSFVLVILAMLFYSSCFAFEVELGGITGLPQLNENTKSSMIIFQVGGVMGLSIVIWFLMSHLAAQIRKRDAALGKSHRNVRRTFESSKTQMYHTAHQMKSPVVAIQSILELFKYNKGRELDPEVAELIEKVDIRCESLLESVSDMMFLAKLKSGQKVTWRLEHLAMKPLTESIIANYSDQVETRKLNMKVEFEDFIFIADRDAIVKLLDNLISNAIRYSKDGGTVEITNKAQGRYFVMQVKDSGIGIKPDQLSKIFDPHYRTTEAKKHCRISTGMGLAIVKEVAAFHDINVNVESKLGTGSCFTLQFPNDQVMIPDGMPLQRVKASDFEEQTA